MFVEQTLKTILTDVWLVTKIVGALALLAVCVRVLIVALCGGKEMESNDEPKRNPTNR